MKIYTLFLLVICFLGSCSRTYKIEIQAGTYNRIATTIYFELPDSVTVNKAINTENGYTFPIGKIGDRYHFILDQPLGKEQKRTYKLAHEEKDIEKNQSAISALTINNEKVLQYNISVQSPSFEAPDYYKRSGFIHPLSTIGGKILTDDFPVGHTHQNGIFNAWVNTTFQGQKVDFWNRQSGSGKVRSQNEETEIVFSCSSKDIWTYEDTLLHIAIDSTDEQRIILQEKQRLLFYEQENSFIFDIYSTQHNVTPDTLFIKKHPYGGMAFRGSKEWNSADSMHFTNDMRILTSQGIQRTESNHTRPNWVCAYGEIEGKIAGIAIFGHPNNFRFPQFIRVHPTMPYLCFTPTVEAGFSIAPNKNYVSQYRFYVFDGEPNVNKIDRLWKDYAHPLNVSLNLEKKK